MKKINNIMNIIFTTYAKKNLVLMIVVKLHSKNTIKSEIIVILLVNTKMLLVIFAI